MKMVEDEQERGRGGISVEANELYFRQDLTLGFQCPPASTPSRQRTSRTSAYLVKMKLVIIWLVTITAHQGHIKEFLLTLSKGRKEGGRQRTSRTRAYLVMTKMKLIKTKLWPS